MVICKNKTTIAVAITIVFVLLLQSYLTYEISTAIAERAAIKNVSPAFCIIAGFCLSVCILLCCTAIIELIATLRKSSLHKVWVRIFWPFVADNIEAEKAKKLADSTTIGYIRSTNKNLRYIGGNISKIFYLDSKNYIQLSLADGKMHVTIGPEVMVSMPSDCKNLSVHKKLEVFIV